MEGRGLKPATVYARISLLSVFYRSGRAATGRSGPGWGRRMKDAAARQPAYNSNRLFTPYRGRIFIDITHNDEYAATA